MPLYVQFYPYKMFHVEHCTYNSFFSAAAAGAPAVHALVATAVAYHDGAADVATGSVSHVDEFGQGVGGVDGACSGTGGGVEIADRVSGGRGRPPYIDLRLWAQVFEEELLLSA